MFLIFLTLFSLLFAENKAGKKKALPPIGKQIDISTVSGKPNSTLFFANLQQININKILQIMYMFFYFKLINLNLLKSRWSGAKMYSFRS